MSANIGDSDFRPLSSYEPESKSISATHSPDSERVTDCALPNIHPSPCATPRSTSVSSRTSPGRAQKKDDLRRASSTALLQSLGGAEEAKNFGPTIRRQLSRSSSAVPFNESSSEDLSTPSTFSSLSPTGTPSTPDPTDHKKLKQQILASLPRTEFTITSSPEEKTGTMYRDQIEAKNIIRAHRKLLPIAGDHPPNPLIVSRSPSLPLPPIRPSPDTPSTE